MAAATVRINGAKVRTCPIYRRFKPLSTAIELAIGMVHVRYLLLLSLPALLTAQSVKPVIAQTCLGCHTGPKASGGLDLTTLPLDFVQQRDRWIRIHDRVEKGEMPPVAAALPAPRRKAFLRELGAGILTAERAEIATQGRGTMRRLNRDEYEQNLRDVLQLPHLDIRDMLPEDREGHHFNKTAETLDMSRVQLTAYLDAAEVALRQAMVTAAQPPAVTKFLATGTQLFPGGRSTGGRESMFYLLRNQGVGVESEYSGRLKPEVEQDPALEMGLFRSPGWPYGAFPKGFAAKHPGQYRLRFSARAVLQQKGYLVTDAKQTVPLTFRSRRPTNHDIAEDTRSTGGILDIQPGSRVYETTVLLNAGQTVEYGLLGLPAPQVDAITPGSGRYRFPPFPPGGQPGVAFLWLEIEGPIAPATWPPASHRVLFDDLGPGAPSAHPREDSLRLLRRFAHLAARAPVPDEALHKFRQLILARLDKQEPFAEAMLAGYKAFLSSGLFLYLPEPLERTDHFSIASRLSHFLTGSRPDARLMELARSQQLRQPKVLRAQADRLIAGEGFERFIQTFPDYWLNLRHLRRDDPDIRLYPEYRLDEYLIDSMDRETRTFLTALVRENLPVTALVKSDFVYANERLARHYGLPAIQGSALRKVTLPNKDSPLGGLLTQASIMKVTANGTSTSPVLRGAWIMDRLLGQPPPPPPPGVPAVEPDIRSAKTIRDLLALHTKSASCAACHAKFDPVGLALENFDVAGAWRTRYRGLSEGERVAGIDPAGHDFAYTFAAPVDASGRLLDGTRFQNVRDLKAILAANPRQLARNLLHQFTVYATGTPVRFADRPEIETILDRCAPQGYRVRDLLEAFVESRIFL